MNQFLSQPVLVLAGASFWALLIWHLISLGRQVQKQSGLVVPWSGIAILSLAVVVMLGISSDYLLETQVSDSVEYILSSQSLAAGGSYHLTFPDLVLPPRFPIWFSLLIGAPFLTIAPGRLELLTIPVALFAMISASTAFLMGLRLRGYMAALLAALFLLGVPGYRAFSQSFLIDIPTTALFQLLALSFICAGVAPLAGLSLFRIGVLAAVACGFRMTSIVLLLPFIWHQFRVDRKNVKSWGALLLPVLVLAGCNVWYNFVTFGSAFRTGYHAWVPVPYEFFSSTFALEFAGKNLHEIFVKSGLGSILLGIAVLKSLGGKTGRARPLVGTDRSLFVFLALAGLPLLLAFTFYFYQTLRFYLPVVALLSCYVASALAWATKIELSAWRCSVSIAIISMLVIPLIVLRPVPVKQQQIADLRRLCAPQTLVIASGNPLWLSSRLAGSCGKVVPFSRNTEFASKAYLPTAPDRTEDLPRDIDTRAFALMHGGIDIYREVAQEHWPEDGDMLLDTSTMSRQELSKASDNYFLEDTPARQVVRLRHR